MKRNNKAVLLTRPRGLRARYSHRNDNLEDVNFTVRTTFQISPHAESIHANERKKFCEKENRFSPSRFAKDEFSVEFHLGKNIEQEYYACTTELFPRF